MSTPSLVPPVCLVVASQVRARHFARATLLGRSLEQFPKRLRPRLYLRAANSGEAAMGLASLYNEAIEAHDDDAILVFLHDDVYLHDWNLTFQLQLALGQFAVVGLVGASGVPYGQPGWAHGLGDDGRVKLNRTARQSGSLNHFDPVLVRPDDFGVAPAAVDLLDGLFLACRRHTLLETGLRFDPQFRFHCYDTDFCYSARRLGLRLGTWPIACTHGSVGSFNAAWMAAASRLMAKLQTLGPLIDASEHPQGGDGLG